MTDSRNQFVLCVDNRGYAASLRLRKVYRRKADARASVHGLVRVIDESGEDYLYPQAMFEPVDVDASVKGPSRRKR